MSKPRAWLELTRGANLPTVWSNVLIGWLLSLAAGAALTAGSFTDLGLALLGASCLYTAGMFLNDAADVEWDRTHRPERPLPLGVLAADNVHRVGLTLLVLGCLACLSISLWVGLAAAGVAGLVLAYTRWHKVHPTAAPLLMGACRSVLPVLGFLTLPPSALGDSVPLLFAHALALGGFTAGISLLARHESGRGEPGRLATVISYAAVLLVPATLFSQGRPPWLVLVGSCGLVLLLGQSRRWFPLVGDRVAFRIAALCLLDYLPWLAIRGSFDRTDPLAMGGLMILLFFGTALALRRLLPST